jgi:hypothetical protein
MKGLTWVWGPLVDDGWRYGEWRVVRPLRLLSVLASGFLLYTSINTNTRSDEIGGVGDEPMLERVYLN